jgi:hypothetical protein
MFLQFFVFLATSIGELRPVASGRAAFSGGMILFTVEQASIFNLHLQGDRLFTCRNPASCDAP